MGAYLEGEKRRLETLKLTAPYFSDAAKLPGVYRRSPRTFCLAVAEENLFNEIRDSALAYFSLAEIVWHDGNVGATAGRRLPSNHLCSSQVACVNFLYPFTYRPAVLAALLKPYFQALDEMRPFESGRFVEFEWIGECNYLNERVRGRERTRGANCTSADAAVLFRRTDGTKQLLLIEWKYTESYGDLSLRFSKNGTDRFEIYRPLLERDDCPIKSDEMIEGCLSLFYEPFYQLMRLQLLAHEIEKAQWRGVSRAAVMHIAPAANSDFKRVTSRSLRQLGQSPVEIWKKVVRNPDRFVSISTEKLFESFPIDDFPDLLKWHGYEKERYGFSDGKIRGSQEKPIA